jgi:hypothetical protein
MTRLAISGHRGMSPATERLVTNALRVEIRRIPRDDLVGLTCLADGADTLFAQAVLELGGSLHVFVPAQKYRDELPPEHHVVYDVLFGQATKVTRLDHVESDSAAHMDASQAMLAEANELVAVWDGKPARGYGGTADVVHAARARGLAVTVVWPAGAERD